VGNGVKTSFAKLVILVGGYRRTLSPTVNLLRGGPIAGQEQQRLCVDSAKQRLRRAGSLPMFRPHAGERRGALIRQVTTVNPRHVRLDHVSCRPPRTTSVGLRSLPAVLLGGNLRQIQLCKLGVRDQVESLPEFHESPRIRRPLERCGEPMGHCPPRLGIQRIDAADWLLLIAPRYVFQAAQKQVILVEDDRSRSPCDTGRAGVSRFPELLPISPVDQMQTESMPDACLEKGLRGSRQPRQEASMWPDAP
jgi:hypothetical protein